MSAPKLNLAAVSSTSVRPQVLSEFSETDQEVILKNVEKRMSTGEKNASTYLERQGFTSQQIQETIAYVQDAADATPPFEVSGFWKQLCYFFFLCFFFPGRCRARKDQKRLLQTWKSTWNRYFFFSHFDKKMLFFLPASLSTWTKIPFCFLRKIR